MTPEEFVAGLKHYCRDSAVSEVVSLMEDPPGRRPDPKLIALASWYRSLRESDKVMVGHALELASDQCFFGVLCVLDGVRVAHEGSPPLFQLTATQDGTTSTLLPGDSYLHDLSRD